jgi:hypothetical protein
MKDEVSSVEDWIVKKKGIEKSERGEVYHEQCGEKRCFLSAALLRFSFLSSPACLGYGRRLGMRRWRD